MNPQIELLAEQAGIQEDLVDHLKDEAEVLTYIARPQDIERFFELIVEGCIEVLSDKRFDNVRPTMNIAQAMIKQHFGVSE